LAGKESRYRDFIRRIENNRAGSPRFSSCSAQSQTGKALKIRGLKFQSASAYQIQQLNPGMDTLRPGQAKRNGCTHIRISQLGQH
jgi:hypothetical protein